ncbi:zinc finger protein 772-like [Suricata suricatta]|uniref:zinc finger protein 772-like n=1 Tax=Suricata suricatta TaxID=37032 RepID=UPI001155B7BF|nr:zinc finger protein 772-like [Suricata suricatta]
MSRRDLSSTLFLVPVHLRIPAGSSGQRLFPGCCSSGTGAVFEAWCGQSRASVFLASAEARPLRRAVSGLDSVAMAEPAAELDCNIVTFEDVCVRFSQEEWELLDEDQRRLYCLVILENLLLVTSLGLPLSRYSLIPQPRAASERLVPETVAVAPAKAEMVQGSPGLCHGAGSKDASSGQGVSIRQSQARTIMANPYDQKSHPCDTCDPILKGILRLAGLQRVSYGQQAYPCPSCTRTFWVTVSTDHILRSQSGEAFPRMEEDPASSGKRCRSHVSEAFTYREDAEYSLASSGCVQHPVAQDEMQLCVHTKSKEVLHTGQQDGSCSECAEAFNNKDQCGQHENPHMRGQLYERNDSENCSLSSSSLQAPQSAHMGSRPNECAQCGKSFKRKYCLVQHQRIHTGLKPFKCSECGKAFGRKTNLVQHEKIHRGERSFVCSICEKAFFRKDTLAVHQTRHTGERSHACDECGKRFTHINYVKVHKKIHKGQRPYVCSECGKTFVRPSQLMRHQKVHTTARPMDEVNVGNSLMTLHSASSQGPTLGESLHPLSYFLEGLMSDVNPFRDPHFLPVESFSVDTIQHRRKTSDLEYAAVFQRVLFSMDSLDST